MLLVCGVPADGKGERRGTGEDNRRRGRQCGCVVAADACSSAAGFASTAASAATAAKVRDVALESPRCRCVSCAHVYIATRQYLIPPRSVTRATTATTSRIPRK